MGFLLNTDLNNQKILHNSLHAVPFVAGDAILTVDHNLGYIPAAWVWYEPQAGRWYPLSTRMYQDAVTNSYVEKIGEYYLTDTQLTVEIRDAGSSADPNINVWVRIYLDD